MDFPKGYAQKMVSFLYQRFMTGKKNNRGCCVLGVLILYKVDFVL